MSEFFFYKGAFSILSFRACASGQERKGLNSGVQQEEPEKHPLYPDSQRTYVTNT